MSNTAHLKFRKRITVERFHALVAEALKATFGDTLKLEGAAPDKGVIVKSERGTCLCQLWYESRGHISVDHRYGSVGYMVSDALMVHLARSLNGRILETGTGKYLDTTKTPVLYFMDIVRTRYENLREMGSEVTLAELTESYRAVEGRLFEGKFNRFWDHGECSG